MLQWQVIHTKQKRNVALRDQIQRNQIRDAFKVVFPDLFFSLRLSSVGQDPVLASLLRGLSNMWRGDVFLTAVAFPMLALPARF